MRSIMKPAKRSKKTPRLGPVQVLRPEQNEAFNVNSKLACIQSKGSSCVFKEGESIN